VSPIAARSYTPSIEASESTPVDSGRLVLDSGRGSTPGFVLHVQYVPVGAVEHAGLVVMRTSATPVAATASSAATSLMTLTTVGVEPPFGSGQLIDGQRACTLLVS
jgi:hypothetical protein